MKTNKFLYGALALMAMGMTACLEDDLKDLGGQGYLQLTATVNSDIKVVQSRAEGEYDAQSLADNCLVWISNSKGLVRQYQGLGEIPAEGVKLNSGHYVAEAWTGDSVSASWTARYFTGRQEFDITRNETAQVNLTCTVANVLASVHYDASVDEVLSDYTMTVGHSRGSLTFEGRTDDKASFMMPSKDTDLTYTLKGKLYDGSEYVKTGTIANVKRATEYAMTVTYVLNESAVGGAYFDISIDPTAIEVQETVEISLAPIIQGMGFDIKQTVYADASSVGRRAVFITSCGEMQSVVVSCPGLGAILGISGDDFDLLNMTDEVKAQLASKGVTHIYSYDADQDGAACKIVFSEEGFYSWPEGDYPIVIAATDAAGKTGTATLHLNISSAKVMALETVTVTPGWGNATATLTGTILDDEVAEAGFYISKNGAAAQYYAGTISGDTFTLSVPDFDPSATYAYYAACPEYTSQVSYQFRGFDIVPGTQIPNGGFEDWNTSSKAYLLAASEAEMYWDSGNHGSSTMNKNVTTPSTDYVHSGKYSAKLMSQFVGLGSIGAFAAGNAFIGKFLKTNTSNFSAYMGWGREFDYNYKPVSLRGYFRYEPGTINYSETDDAVKGEMDQGIIYWALLDDYQQTYDGYTYPWVIYSADKSTLFDRNNEHVIAYGEHVFATATAGDGLVEINIPLEYKSDTKPTYLVCVISSSRYGDYFSGGTGSTLYVDDLEIIY